MAYVSGTSPSENKQGSWNQDYLLKPLAYYYGNPPVLNTVNTVVDLKSKRLRIVQIVVLQKNDEAQAKNLDLAVTIDGTTYTATAQAATNNTPYPCNISYSPTAFSTAYGLNMLGGATGTERMLGSIDYLNCSNFKFTVALKTAAGTNQKLYAAVMYCEA